MTPATTRPGTATARSFRVQLATRATAVVTLALVALSAVTLMTLKAVLDAELDASILNVASIQAASLTDSPDGQMHFHEWELTPDEASSVRDLIQYAQVWSAEGSSLLRSRYMTSDLPVDPQALRQVTRGEVVWTEQRFEGAEVRTLFYPLERMGQAHEAHVLQVAAPLARRNDMLWRAGMFLALLTAVLAGVIFTGSWWLAGRAVGPIHEVIDQAEEIGAGSLDRRIQAYADTTEYRRLVEVLNTMLARLQGSFEAQRRFAADASHELRSPLTAMRGEIELALRRDRPSDEYVRVLESTLEEVVRLSTITNDLLTIARSDSGALAPRRERADVVAIATAVANRLRGRAEARSLTLEVTGEAAVDAMVDAGLIGQAAWNLMDNAIKFTPPGGSVWVSIRRDGNEIVISVSDTGPGLGDIDPGNVFERFYRADPVRSRGSETAGTGLGLAIVKAVADVHGGTVRARERPEGGALFELRFPATPPPKGAAPPSMRPTGIVQAT